MGGDDAEFAGTHNTAAPAAAGGTPVATLPLTTVPVSPLAAEIEAAYVAAWEDIKVAAQLDNYETPQLADRIVEPMLEKFRGLLRGLDVDGRQLVWDSPDDSWHRIEAIEQSDNGEVTATICAYFDDVTLGQGTGEIVDRDGRSAIPTRRSPGRMEYGDGHTGRRPIRVATKPRTARCRLMAVPGWPPPCRWRAPDGEFGRGRPGRPRGGR
ncbi:MAG: hypothetical protein IPG46_15325 [Actinobacteria bacterium]|nr:hypothetical protein [Actinomycetota bacterium]